MGIETSTEVNEIFAALAIAQGKIENAKKDSINTITKGGLTARYADMAAVVEVARLPLSENGLAIIQMPETAGPEVRVYTRLTHKSGQWIQSALTLVSTSEAPQQIGSAITYARRYAYMAMVGIAPDDDDDGEKASTKRKPPAVQKQTSSFPPKDVNDAEDVPYTATDAQKRTLMVWAGKYQVHDRAELAAISQRLLDGGAAMYELEEAIPKIVEKLRAEATGI